MTDQIQTGGEAVVAEELEKGWRPSGRPTHRKDATEVETGRIVQQEPEVGLLGAFARYLKRPFVRLVIGLGVFILAAIVYDKTVNFGDWTERKAKPQATRHDGIAPVQQTPDG